MSPKIFKLRTDHAYGYRIGISKADFKALSALYDKLYEDAEIVLARYDPCKIEDGKCLAGKPCCYERGRKCENLSKKDGCAVKSLACKLFLCDKAKKAFPGCAAALSELSEEASENRFLAHRASKEDIFSDYEIIDR